MKTVNNIYSKIYEFSNLFRAAKQALACKRWKAAPLEFSSNIDTEIIELQQELRSEAVVLGEYYQFKIYEPKERLISAAPFRDRVLHHAICNIIEPIFERTFIPNSFANRKGKGTHQALTAFKTYFAETRYSLKCDIKKYFPSIDHEILKTAIRKKIYCRKTLALLDAIIEHSCPQEPMNEYFENDDLFSPFERRKGIPIGNLTSQFFANIYLNGFDHFIKETLRCKRYVRYVDDFVLFSNDKEDVKDWRKKIEWYLETLRLRIHTVKSQITEKKNGVNFLGFRFFPHYIRIRSENLKRARKRMNALEKDFFNGRVTARQVRDSVVSWKSHLAFASKNRLLEVIDKRYEKLFASVFPH